MRRKARRMEPAPGGAHGRATPHLSSNATPRENASLALLEENSRLGTLNSPALFSTNNAYCQRDTPHSGCGASAAGRTLEQWTRAPSPTTAPAALRRFAAYAHGSHCTRRQEKKDICPAVLNFGMGRGPRNGSCNRTDGRTWGAQDDSSCLWSLSPPSNSGVWVDDSGTHPSHAVSLDSRDKRAG